LKVLDLLPTWLIVGIYMVPYFAAVAVLRLTKAESPLLWLSLVVIAYALAYQVWFSWAIKRIGKSDRSADDPRQ